MSKMQNENSYREIDFEKLIKLARKAIESKTIVEADIKEKMGVFVTLKTFPERKLRGCIGFIEPIFPLGESVQRAAISAAYSDPRFKPLNEDEIEKITIEVSILSLPKRTSIEKLKIGDGTILEIDNHKGIFLPQVWDKIPNKEKFLDALCLKSELYPNCWKEKNIKFYKFHITAFEETSPNGDIIKTR